MEFAGSANTYLVLQAVSYHQLRLIFESRSDDGAYSTLRNAILFPENDDYVIKKKLNYSTISLWTGLDKETVRRACKNLEKRHVLKVHSTSGIELDLNGGLGAQLLNLHEKVKPLLVKFLSKATRG